MINYANNVLSIWNIYNEYSIFNNIKYNNSIIIFINIIIMN